MNAIEKKIRYFPDYGSQNTGETIEAVRERIENNDIKTVVVASTTGDTGVGILEALGDKANVIVVSHQEMNSSYRQKIMELGGKVVEKSHLPLHEKGMNDVRETYRTFGQGMKVAVEVILIAADRGELMPYEDVIGIGGTARGADTAVVARATQTKEMFSTDDGKKLEIREILAMPLKKKWW